MEMNNLLLPDDVLHELFKYLDGESLKQAALVCKTWNNVIESSTATMKHFRLNLKSGEFGQNIIEHFSEIMDLQREFQEMEMEICEENYQLLEKISTEHGSKVRKLTIHSTEFNAGDSFSNLLRNFQKLKELKLCNSNLDGNFLNCVKVTLSSLQNLKISCSKHDFLNNLYTPNLKSLELMNTDSSTECLKTFLETCPNLETLIFQNDEHYLSIFDNHEHLPFNLKTLEVSNDGEAFMDGMENFLQKFSNLEVLTLSAGMIGNVMFPEPQNVPFKLNKLDFTLWSPYIRGIINDNYVAFLETQKWSLKELKTISLFQDSVEVDAEYLSIFNQMKCLEKLTFDKKNTFPKEQQFYDELVATPTVKEIRFKNLEKLDIEVGDREEMFLRGILPKLPNLELFESFHSVDNFPDLLSYLSTNNSKLATLSLWTLEDYEMDVKFQFLKTLNLKFVKNVETFQKFMRNHPTIESLNIERIGDRLITY